MKLFRKGEGPLPACCVANGEKQRSGGAVRRVNRGSDRVEAPFGRTVPGAFRGSKEARMETREPCRKSGELFPENGEQTAKSSAFLYCSPRGKRCKARAAPHKAACAGTDRPMPCVQPSQHPRAVQVARGAARRLSRRRGGEAHGLFDFLRRKWILSGRCLGR